MKLYIISSYSELNPQSIVACIFMSLVRSTSVIVEELQKLIVLVFGAFLGFIGVVEKPR
jgi:hypothetical protein